MLYGFKVGDQDHIKTRWQERFPDLDYKLFNRILRKGLDKIRKIHKYDPRTISNYMIVSQNTDVKIPIEIEDKKNVSNVIYTTVLSQKDNPINKKHEIEVNVNV